jgi:CHAT domain-containing protein
MRKRPLLFLGVLLALGAAPAGSSPLVAGEECEARVRDAPESLESYRCFWLLARQNKADEAERRLRALLLRAPANHRARLFLARIGGDLGRDWAEPLFREAIGGLQAAGDLEGEVFARLGLGLFLNRRHRFGELETEVAAARAAADKRGDATLRAWVRNEEAALVFRKGDYAAALRLYKEVEEQVVPDGPPALQALCLGGLAGVAQQTGRHAESVEYVRRQAEMNHRAGDFYDEARARGNLVISGFRLIVDGQMEPEEVVAWAREALAAAVAGGNPGSEARAHLYLGELLPGREGREHYERGLALSQDNKETANLIIGLRGLALSLVEYDPQDVPRAYRLVDEALERARGSRYYMALASVARARLRWITGPRERAVADSLAALEAIENVRDLQDDDLVRARVFSTWAFAYHRLAGKLLAGSSPSPEDLELAFQVTERMRARVLLDELDAAQATGGLFPAGPARQRRQELLRRIAEAQRKLMDPALAADERRVLVRDLERREREEAALRAEAAHLSARYAALRQPTLPTLEELRAALADDEAVVAFQVATRRNGDNRTTEDGSWAWVHTREGTRVYPIPDGDALRPAVSLFLGLVERRDGSEAEAAPSLYADLLQRPLEDLPPGVRRLVLVPDAVLHRVPFDALRATTSGEPLAARFQTSLAPSATLWLRGRREAAKPTRAEALALADPDLGGAALPAAERGWTLALSSPPGPLPHARAEARFVVRRMGGVFKAGRDATELYLKSADLGRFGIVHLAAHALVDEQAPDRSAVLLAPGGKGEDGLLQIRELVGLDLDRRVVVLSACRSASGAVFEGEGVMGLARGFFQAGARAVVGSLWPLRDDEAERIVRGLYRHLAEGRSVAAALATARREAIHDGRPAAAWAGLVVLGDGDAVPVPGGRSAPVRVDILALAGLAAALGLLAWWRRHARRAPG